MELKAYLSAATLPLVAALSMAGANPALAQQASTGKKPAVAVYQSSSSRTFLGVAVVEVTSERAKALKLKEESGVELTRVDDESPASKAGLKAGDVVLEYNGQRVEGTEQFIRLVRETPPGREVRMQVSRDGQTMQVRATVESRKSALHVMPRVEELVRMPDIPRPLMNWRSPYLGIEAESLTAQLAQFFGVKEGVLVRSVTSGSAAEKAGLKAGDIITKVEDKNVTSPMEVTSSIRQLDKQSFAITIVREKREMPLTVTISTSESGRPRARSIRLDELKL